MSESDALVAIDVIRATTTAITAVAMGRRCYPVPTIEAAKELTRTVSDALLVGELGGVMPAGFDINNSPAELAARTETRPIILLSSSGTQVIDSIRNSQHAFIACFRNLTATIRALSSEGRSVTLIGAGTRGQFREEDQMCAAWIAVGLVDQGHIPADRSSEDLIRKWKYAHLHDFLISESVAYLRRSNQMADLDFILSHFDDVHSSFKVIRAQIVEQ
jgi:2-phosphosulfolactate phosphatase